MCEKDFHMRAYVSSLGFILSDLCQITSVSSSLNFSVSTFVAKWFHISPMGLRWHTPHSHILGLQCGAAAQLFSHVISNESWSQNDTKISYSKKSILALGGNIYIFVDDPWFGGLFLLRCKKKLDSSEYCSWNKPVLFSGKVKWSINQWNDCSAGTDWFLIRSIYIKNVSKCKTVILFSPLLPFFF